MFLQAIRTSLTRSCLVKRASTQSVPSQSAGTAFNQISVLSLKSTEPVKVIDLPPEVFCVPVRKDILHRLVVWKLACKRQGTASKKNRSEMAGSKKKFHKQKGLGTARVGQKRSPVRRGGGNAFPPKPRDFSYTLPKKVRLLGLKCALSSKFAQNKLVILEDFDLETIKTKKLNEILKTRGWENSLWVDGEELTPFFTLASRNLKSLDLVPQPRANVYDMLRRKLLVLNLKSLDYLIKRANGQLPTILKKRKLRAYQKRQNAALLRQKVRQSQQEENSSTPN